MSAVKLGTRRKVYFRDKGRCRYCNKGLTLAEATMDHVVPRSKGGRSTKKAAAST